MKIFIISLFLTTLNVYSAPKYCWGYNTSETIVSTISAPKGFSRVEVKMESFAEWLRQLPLKKKGSKVFLYNKKSKRNQNIHHSVVDIDVGNKNLQQCADAVIRLRAEYLFSRSMFEKIHFNFTSGDNAQYLKWKNGFRPVVSGNMVHWKKAKEKNNSYDCFRDYLNSVFMYAGTSSLQKELTKILSTKNIKIGDVFIKGGFPGHAVIVADMAINENTGKKVILLLQSYMPAQNIHILKNTHNKNLSPWYEVKESGNLHTPEWTFNWLDLHRFD